MFSSESGKDVGGGGPLEALLHLAADTPPGPGGVARTPVLPPPVLTREANGAVHGNNNNNNSAPTSAERARAAKVRGDLSDALARERALRLQAEAGCSDACLLLEDAQAALSGAVALKEERDRLHAQLSQERAERRRLTDALQMARDDAAQMEEELMELQKRKQQKRAPPPPPPPPPPQETPVPAMRVFEELARVEELERRVEAAEAGATSADVRAAAAERRAEGLSVDLKRAKDDVSQKSMELRAERAEKEMRERRCRELEVVAKEVERLKSRQVLLEGANVELRRQIQQQPVKGGGGGGGGGSMMHEVSLMADAIDGIMSEPPPPPPKQASPYFSSHVLTTSDDDDDDDNDNDEDEDEKLLQLTKEVSVLGRVALASLKQQQSQGLQGEAKLML